MIKFTNNTTKIKIDEKELFDLNEDVNNISIEEINLIKSKLSEISSIHEAEVIFNGKLGNVSILVNSKSNESSKIIQDLIKSYRN